MPNWLGLALAVVVVVLVAPLIGWSVTRAGRQRIRRYTAMGSMMLGFGIPFDPPQRHVVEASEKRVTKGDETGDPPDPDVSPPKPSNG